MDVRIEQYLVTEKKVESPVVRSMLMKKITKYDDIKNEFLNWLKRRDYSDAKLEVNGYTAGDICGMAPLLDGIGVYNFLVDLRDNPEAAHKAIDSGFVVK